MVLYMLNCVNFPLTTAQIAEFILDRDYTNFLTLQTVFSDLTETGLAQSKTILNRTQLSLTEEGKNTLHYFENPIKDDIREYFTAHRLELRNESSIQGDYYKLVNGEFEAQLVAKDKDVDLVGIRLSVPTEELAASHGIRNYAGVVLHLEDLQKWSDEILGDFVLTKDQALHNFKTDSINQ